MFAAMLRKQRGLVPYRVDTSAAPSAPAPTWRSRVRFLFFEGLAAVVFTAIIVGAVMLAAPLGQPFADFIDRLAGVAR